MLKFDFYNHTRQRVSKKLFKKILKSAKKVLVKEKKMSAVQDFCFEISLIGLAAMARINKRYRGRNRPTDVISLSYFNKSVKSGLKVAPPRRGINYLAKSTASRGGGLCLIGEIFICMPYVIKQAKKLGNTLNKELQFLFIHGFLHIFGYDHKEKRGADYMEKLTKEILGNN